MLVIGVTGFCITPLRDAGVITIPELFEKRFGARVRWASGVVIVLGGLLNMGVFLRMGGQFLVQVCGLPQTIRLFGHDVEFLVVMMTVLLAGVALYTILGGMLSVLVTDFLQFVVMSVGLIAVTVLILVKVGWGALVDAVQQAHGAGGFCPLSNPSMGWPYLLFNLLLMTAVVLTWQTTIARVLAAKDSRTGRKIYTGTSFFFVCRFLIPGIWGIAALAVLGKASGVSSLDAMPQFLSTFVPVGLMGVLIAAMLAADMSTDSSYMLTWASVIYNDILRPIHKGLWSQRTGLLVNRLLVGAIGIFLLLYGLWYPLKGDLWTYLGVTGTIYLASMSVLLIACCYWKKANNWGAVAAIVAGALIPIGYLVFEQLPATKALAARIGPYYSGIATYALVALAMIIGSLLKPAARPSGVRT
jgi:SSS family solute:Na+ symporter